MHWVFVLSHQQWPVTCAWTRSLIWSSLKVNKSAPWLHCCFVGGTLELMRTTCKSFHATPFTLLIVPYNSVYYNCIIIMQWLVLWFGYQGKKGVCISKKVHCGPVVPRYFCCSPSKLGISSHFACFIRTPSSADQKHFLIWRKGIQSVLAESQFFLPPN